MKATFRRLYLFTTMVMVYIFFGDVSTSTAIISTVSPTRHRDVHFSTLYRRNRLIKENFLPNPQLQIFSDLPPNLYYPLCFYQSYIKTDDDHAQKIDSGVDDSSLLLPLAIVAQVAAETRFIPISRPFTPQRQNHRQRNNEEGDMVTTDLWVLILMACLWKEPPWKPPWNRQHFRFSDTKGISFFMVHILTFLSYTIYGLTSRIFEHWCSQSFYVWEIVSDGYRFKPWMNTMNANKRSRLWINQEYQLQARKIAIPCSGKWRYLYGSRYNRWIRTNYFQKAYWSLIKKMLAKQKKRSYKDEDD